MGTNVYYGRADFDPSKPDTMGICDRCGNLWNLRDLQYQFQWAGTELINLHLRVCPDCMDIPSEFLRTIILPPDPEPIYDGRPANFAAMEKNEYTLKPASPGAFMFSATSSFTAALLVGKDPIGFQPNAFQGNAFLAG